MVRSELLDDYLTVGDGNPKLVLVGKREVCNEPLGDVDQPFTLGSKVKTAGSMFFSHLNHFFISPAVYSASSIFMTSSMESSSCFSFSSLNLIDLNFSYVSLDTRICGNCDVDFVVIEYRDDLFKLNDYVNYSYVIDKNKYSEVL